MTPAQWVALGLEAVALVLMLVIVLSYGRDLDEVKADRDEDAARIADLNADLAETRARLLQLAQHVTASEPPSSGRHARIAA